MLTTGYTTWFTSVYKDRMTVLKKTNIEMKKDEYKIQQSDVTQN